MAERAPKSLPLILARELASNLATPTFIVDGLGMLVFFDEAAELLIGKSVAELGEISGNDFGALIDLHDESGEPLSTRESPAGLAFYERRPAHRLVSVLFKGERRLVEATAYPLCGAADELHGVVTVFWPTGGA